jgi:hypothetical protein
MKHILILTDNYLLVIDNSEIKELNYIYDLDMKRIVVADDLKVATSKASLCWYYKKIISHRPFNGAPYLHGVDVLPLIDNVEKDDVEKLAYEWFVTANKKDTIFDLGWVNIFTSGYNKAREKYKYTEEDLRKGIKMSIQKHPYAFDGKETKYKYSEDEIIQSLQLPKYPIAFECEMITMNEGYTEESDYPYQQCEIPKTIVNSEGRTEWVGKYIYE